MSTFDRFHTGDVSWTAGDPDEAAPTAFAGSPVAYTVVPGVMTEIDAMEQGDRPTSLTPARWYALLRDTRAFAEQWLDIAITCGWSLSDVYGVPEDLRHAGLGGTGVVYLLDGRPVVSIDADRIVIGEGPGSLSTFYRHSPGVSHPFDRRCVDLIWNVVRQDRAAGV